MKIEPYDFMMVLLFMFFGMMFVFPMYKIISANTAGLVILGFGVFGVFVVWVIKKTTHNNTGEKDE